MRRHAAPHVDARPARRSFVGIELAAQHRVDAVATDGDAALDRARIAAVDGAQANADALGTDRIDADAGVAGDHAIGAESLAHRREQHRLKVAAMDRELRHVVTGPAAGRLGIDELSEAVEERRFTGDDGTALERVEYTESL